MTVLVSGPRACFRRPEMGEDLVTYDAMPPPVALRIFDTIYRAPTESWVVEEIEVLNPVRTGWSEVTGAQRIARRMHVLFDVAYRLTGRLVARSLASCDPRTEDALRRRMTEAPPPVFLGLKEFPAHLELHGPDHARDFSGAKENRDLGWMTYDFEGAGRSRPRFFRALLCDGVIDLRAVDSAALAL